MHQLGAETLESGLVFNTVNFSMDLSKINICPFFFLTCKMRLMIASIQYTYFENLMI